MADRVAVMYADRVVEYGSQSSLFAEPRHPYTHVLLAAVLDARTDAQYVAVDVDFADDDLTLSAGFPFRSRCPIGRGREICAHENPPLAPVGEGGHLAACHFPQTASSFRHASEVLLGNTERQPAVDQEVLVP